MLIVSGGRGELLLLPGSASTLRDIMAREPNEYVQNLLTVLSRTDLSLVPKC